MLAGLLASFKTIPWKLVFCVAFALMVFLALDLSARLAAAKEREEHLKRAAALQIEAMQIVAEEAQAFRDRTQALDRRLAQSIEALESVPDDADAAVFLSAWARADRSLREPADAR